VIGVPGEDAERFIVIVNMKMEREKGKIEESTLCMSTVSAIPSLLWHISGTVKPEPLSHTVLGYVSGHGKYQRCSSTRKIHIAVDGSVELGKVENFQVTGINLENNNLQGTLPPNMSKLMYLVTIDLESNGLLGSIPDSLQSLPYLYRFKLSSNSLTGRLDGWVCPVPVLDLRDNMFTCPLPKCCSKSGDGDNENIAGMCEPCISSSLPLEIIVPAAVGGLLVVVVVVVFFVRRRRVKEISRSAYVMIDEDDATAEALAHSTSNPSVVDTHAEQPLWWHSAQRDGGVALEDVTEEYRDLIMDLMHSQGVDDLRVGKVFHLENVALWKQYVSCHSSIKAHLPKRQGLNDCAGQLGEVKCKCVREWMREKVGLDVEGSEAMLFHGTVRKYVKYILTQGFDTRVGALEGKYGAGCYFAEDVQKSLQYMKPGSKGKMILFLARVCLGYPYISESRMPFVRRAPVGKRSGRVCDSVIGVTSKKYREFIVYDRHQCY